MVALAACTPDAPGRPAPVAARPDGRACDEVRGWVVESLRASLERRVLVRSAKVMCSPSVPLPPQPEVGAPLPKGAVTLLVDLAVFDEGDPVAVVASTQEALGVAAERLGVDFYSPSRIAAYPPALWGSSETPRAGLEESGVLGFAALAEVGRTLWTPPEPVVRDSATEARVADALAEVLPDARIHVWVPPKTVWTTRHVMDVRVVHPDLTLATMGSLALRLDAEALAARPFLSGVAYDSSGATKAAFECSGSMSCEAVEGILDPTLLGPATRPGRQPDEER